MDLWTIEIKTDNKYNIIETKLRKRDEHYKFVEKENQNIYLLHRRHKHSEIKNRLEKKRGFRGEWIYSFPTLYGNNKNKVDEVIHKIKEIIGHDKFVYDYDKLIPEVKFKSLIIEDLYSKKLFDLNYRYRGIEFIYKVLSLEELSKYESFAYAKEKEHPFVTDKIPTKYINPIDGVIVGYSSLGDILKIGIYNMNNYKEN